MRLYSWLAEARVEPVRARTPTLGTAGPTPEGPEGPVAVQPGGPAALAGPASDQRSASANTTHLSGLFTCYWRNHQ